MKQQLKPSGWLDLFTRDEADDVLQKAVDELERRARTREPRTIRGPGVNDETDGSGDLELIVYRVPQGMRFVLHRLLIRAAGYSSSAPFTGAGVSIDVHRDGSDGELIDFAAGQIPAVIKDGSGAGYTFLGGETVAIVVTKGPADTVITGTPVGKLYPPPEPAREARGKR